MNCPVCKNPISDNSTTCEWCGAKIQSNQNVETNITVQHSVTENEPLRKKPSAIITIIAIILIILGTIGVYRSCEPRNSNSFEQRFHPLSE